MSETECVSLFGGPQGLLSGVFYVICSVSPDHNEVKLNTKNPKCYILELTGSCASKSSVTLLVNKLRYTIYSKPHYTTELPPIINVGPDRTD